MKQVLGWMSMLALALAVLMSSCSSGNDVVSKGPIQKRKYRKGYFVDGGSARKDARKEKVRVACLEEEEVVTAELEKVQDAELAALEGQKEKNSVSVGVGVSEEEVKKERKCLEEGEVVKTEAMEEQESKLATIVGNKPLRGDYSAVATTALAVEGDFFGGRNLLRNGLILILIGLILSILGGLSGVIGWVGGVLILIGLIMVLIYLIQQL